MAEQPPTPDPEQPEPLETGGSLMPKVFVGGFLSAIVLAECAAAYLWIPSASDVAALAEQQIAQDSELSDAAAKEEEQETEEDPVVEVDLGSYGIAAQQPASNTTLRVDFHLWATVLEDDESEFSTLFARNEHRFRDQIIIEIRNADIRDVTDPELGLIKRRILEKSNKLFGKRILQSIMFSDFSFMEQ